MFMLARLDLQAILAITMAAVRQNIVAEVVSRALEVLLYSKLNR